MTKISFEELNIIEPICKALEKEGYKYPTPIQAKVIPHLLEGGDVIGCAQTGTGKTAAFAIPMLQNLTLKFKKMKSKEVRSLILTPTRELAIQIGDNFETYGKNLKIKHATIYGGVSEFSQIKALRNGVDVLIATPGRLLDLTSRAEIDLSKVEIFVLDEADRMLDMGFILDVKKIERAIPLKEKRQTLFFSATFPDAIKRFANNWTNEAVTVEIEPDTIAADTVTQINYIVEASEKFKLLFNILKQDASSRVLIFCNRKDTAKDLFDRLEQYEISSTLLSGDIDQRKRMNRLKGFKEGKFRVLVATDVAGRGIHIDNVSHVINYNLPVDPEDYVHRIGRTGRAGLAGISISFACDDDSFNIPNIEEYLKNKLELIYPDDNLLEELPPVLREKKIEDKNSGDLAKKYPQKKSFNNKNGYKKNYSKTKNSGSKE